jgi:hypothetical protein
MNQGYLSKTKRNTMQIYGTPEHYEGYKRTIEATKQLYSDDFSFYNDTVAERH